MKEYNKENIDVVENYKEEGAVTVESLDVAHHVKHSSHAGERKGSTLTTPVAIVIASIILSGGLMGYGAITQGGSSSTSATLFKGKAIDEKDYVTGKEDSKIIVVEYSDPSCPYCIQLSSTIKKIKTDYSDKVAFVYRHFPLTQLHPKAVDESRAMACAGVIGGTEKFYAYENAFFDYKLSKQTSELPATGKEDFARAIGLDMKAFAECMSTKQTEQTVTDSINDGVAAGVQGTPSTFILKKTRKGYEVVAMVDGARPYEFFKAAIDQALGK